MDLYGLLGFMKMNKTIIIFGKISCECERIFKKIIIIIIRNELY